MSRHYDSTSEEIHIALPFDTALVSKYLNIKADEINHILATFNDDIEACGMAGYCDLDQIVFDAFSHAPHAPPSNFHTVEFFNSLRHRRDYLAEYSDMTESNSIDYEDVDSEDRVPAENLMYAAGKSELVFTILVLGLFGQNDKELLDYYAEILTDTGIIYDPAVISDVFVATILIPLEVPDERFEKTHSYHRRTPDRELSSGTLREIKAIADQIT